jgi:hypothetical protein
MTNSLQARWPSWPAVAMERKGQEEERDVQAPLLSSRGRPATAPAAGSCRASRDGRAELTAVRG